VLYYLHRLLIPPIFYQQTLADGSLGEGSGKKIGSKCCPALVLSNNAKLWACSIELTVEQLGTFISKSVINDYRLTLSLANLFGLDRRGRVLRDS